MKVSEKAEKELVEFAVSTEFRRDMEMLRVISQSPFVKDGRIDVDAYLEFVQQFNEFINHQPKPLKPMIDKVMKL